MSHYCRCEIELQIQMCVKEEVTKAKGRERDKKDQVEVMFVNAGRKTIKEGKADWLTLCACVWQHDGQR